MYNQLIHSNGTAWEIPGTMRMFADRFNKFSNAADAASVSLSDPQTLKRLQRVRSILIYEHGTTGDTSDLVRVGKIKNIRHSGEFVEFEFSEEGRLRKSSVPHFSQHLALNNFEHGHTHWAIKEGRIPVSLLSKLIPSNFHCFLCHASEDKPFARELAFGLERLGVKVWIDEAEIHVGESIVEKINQALDDVTHVIVLLSRSSVRKAWVKKELSAALMRKLSRKSISLLPVVLDNCRIPILLGDIKYADGKLGPANTVCELERAFCQK